ncbi:MAG TPA: trigger factor [Candidatus Woesebacteria bacterium]|nr:trigger factor [Candidatus Woesebacteria bacterium]
MTKTKTETSNSTAQPPLIVANTILTISFPWTQVEPEYQKALNKMAKQLAMPGFRKGMVPPHIAEEQLKPEALVEAVLQRLLPKAYQEALEKEHKRPISDPEFDPKVVTKGADWQIEVHLAEKPSVNATNYVKIAKEAKKAALVHLKEEAKKKEQSTDDSHEKQHQDDHILQHIFQDLVKTCKPQLPELLVKQQTRRELERLVQELQSMKLTLDDFLSRNNQTFEQLSGNIAARAVGQLQLEFILQAISQQAEITVTEAEIEEVIAKIGDEKVRKEKQTETHYLEAIREHLSRKKLFDHLLTIA